MPSTQQYYNYTPTPAPNFNSTTKAQTFAPYSNQPHYLQPSSPERASSLTTATTGTYSTPTSSQSSSTSDDVVPLDLLDYLSDRFSHAVDASPLDRSLAQQAQTSGALNAKQRELLEMQALAQRRLAMAQVNFRDGLKSAKECQRELGWMQGRVTALNQRAAQKYPLQYRAASGKYPSYVDY